MFIEKYFASYPAGDAGDIVRLLGSYMPVLHGISQLTIIFIEVFIS
jgi:hypothetical protein